MQRLIGKKQEMTQVFTADGSIVPVTIVDISGNLYLGSRSQDLNGYTAAILGFGKKPKPTKSETGVYKNLGYVPEVVVESRDDTYSQPESGTRAFEDLTDKKVSVTGVTKGKGFQGGVKRWGFKGGKVTHGQSDRMRAPGSIGSGTTPGRVYKGKKMAGRMGGDRKTIANLKIVRHIIDSNILLIKGAIPGSRGSKLIITIAD